MLKFWAWIYRLTGWYSPWARIEEYKALKEWLHKDDTYLTISQLGLCESTCLFIGNWQADNGFARKDKFFR